jgi:hypothetical protein
MFLKVTINFTDTISEVLQFNSERNFSETHFLILLTYIFMHCTFIKMCFILIFLLAYISCTGGSHCDIDICDYNVS